MLPAASVPPARKVRREAAAGDADVVDVWFPREVDMVHV
jgi:hypothetical protein